MNFKSIKQKLTKSLTIVNNEKLQILRAGADLSRTYGTPFNFGYAIRFYN